MEEIKQKLVDGGVIGRVVGDFNPQLRFRLDIDHIRISIGDKVSAAALQAQPNNLQFFHNPDHPEILEMFRRPRLVVLIMTDIDAPHGEYLHWLMSDFMRLAPYVPPSIPRPASGHTQHLVPYEPPRPMGLRRIVLTVFIPNEPPRSVPNSRENFSTRSFADNNALGQPLAASFFDVDDRNGGEITDGDASPTRSTATSTYGVPE